MVGQGRCPNPSCGRPSRLAGDALGRTFRCPHCGTKLPRGGSDGATGSMGRARGSARCPWEDEAESATPPLGSALPRGFGRFVVRGVLGKGSCATVYRAFDPELARDVALKVPSPEAAAGEKALARFGSEARALARLRHRAIISVFEAGRFGDLPYLATDCIDGRTLRDLLEDGPPEATHAAGIACELAEALGYMHEVGLVHRDVKPANILLGKTGTVHLSDFGLACPIDEAPARPAGVLVGTPAYVSPEQASSEGRAASPSGDQYSLGIVFYELLCGRPPFLGPPALVLYAASRDDPIAPRELRRGVPRELERICLKAMARQPEARYASCLALAADLRAWLRGRRAGEGRSRPSGTLGRARAWLGRRRPTAALTAALALIGLVTLKALATALRIAP